MIEKKIYRVYAEEKKVKGYFQDVIASSKEEAQKLAENNTEYHQWEDNPDEDGTHGLEFTTTIESRYPHRSSKWDEYKEVIDEHFVSRNIDTGGKAYIDLLEDV